MTFSIVARSADAGMFGVAIASSSPAVAARCAYARAGAGAVATQSMTDPALGPLILEELALGATARTALADGLRMTPFGAYRQLAVIGREGVPAVHTGALALGTAGESIGAHAAAAGNLLSHSSVPAAMVAAFEAAKGHLGDRLLSALDAGCAQGGEVSPVRSAGLLLVRDVPWPIADLRVDWSRDNPIVELASLWALYAPQIEDYVRRAIDPARLAAEPVRSSESRTSSQA